MCCFGNQIANLRVSRESGTMKEGDERDETFRLEVRLMAIVREPGFPLLESDQADIIRLFIEFMRTSTSAGRPAEAAKAKKPIERHHDPRSAETPGELLDRD
jgi:hypothetical protein